MTDIEPRTFAKPRREEPLRTFTEAHRFNIKKVDKFVGSFPVRSRNPGWRR